MSETLYLVTYLKHSLLEDAKRLTVELTQVELGEFLLNGTITLIEVTRIFENGELKRRSNGGV
jgi:hypothetical protein